MNGFFDSLLIRGLAPLEVKQRGSDCALWELLADFSYISDRLRGIVVVPKGMITDFASIPRSVWGVISPDDPMILFPSVIHDYLYSVKGVLPDGRTYSREDADAVLREAMEACGAESLMREAVYQAVRSGGASHWD